MLPRFLLTAVLCAAAMVVQAEQLDPAYVAYAEVPGPTRSSPSFYLLVAEENCPAKGAPPGWQRGAYLYTHGEEPACWKLDGEKVKFCPQGQYETTYRETSYGSTTVDPCHVWPKDKFYERGQ